MIDTWFKKDLDKIYASRNIVVLVDESTDAAFLLDGIDDSIQLYKTDGELDELKVKYEIEKQADESLKYLIYTTTPKSDMKFLREYCETNGHIEIKYLEHYIKRKVEQHLNLNINLPKEELISAAKVSIGKDETYWMDISHKGASEIFDLEKELLPFINNPRAFLNKYDKKVQTIFFKKVNELIGQPYVKKPATTLATEVVNYMLDGLLNNKPHKLLLAVYYHWLDSHEYRKSFNGYLKKYKSIDKSEIFNIHASHPFIDIDKLWLKELGLKINNKAFISSFLPKINQRIKDKAARALDLNFWKYIKVLLEFDELNINQLSSLDECIVFYTRHFHKLDHAIRNLYATFINEKELIEPLQDFYKNLSVLFLDKWFRYIDDYQSNQTGVIQNIIDDNPHKTAIIVGDGVSYEFAQDIIVRVSNEYDLDKDKTYLLAGLPSETEHNMSQLYVQTGEVLPKKSDREKYILNQNKDKDIVFIDLDTVNELTDKHHYLICSHKDPDKLGETYQQKALKYFDTVAGLFAEKVEQLLQNGYQNVYLLTDHGFVLTGLLNDSDKIEVMFNGPVKINERYILASQPQVIDTDLLWKEKCDDKGFHYIYYAKRLGPFRTPGVYGFSHGGLSPQETIIPYLKWSNNNLQEDLLQVYITNKNELNDVVGMYYAIRLKAEKKADSLFNTERKLILMFFSNSKKINQSDIISIGSGDEIKKEYSFDSYEEIEVRLLDADSKEQLDKVMVKASNARDLGGLM